MNNKSKALDKVKKAGKREIERYNSMPHEEKMKHGKYFSYATQSFQPRKQGVDFAGVKRGRSDKDVNKYYGK